MIGKLGFLFVLHLLSVRGLDKTRLLLHLYIYTRGELGIC